MQAAYNTRDSSLVPNLARPTPWKRKPFAFLTSLKVMSSHVLASVLKEFGISWAVSATVIFGGVR